VRRLTPVHEVKFYLCISRAREIVVVLSRRSDPTIKNMAQSFPILTFHAVDDRPSVISFPPALFARGMALLHDKGYRTLSLTELSDSLRGQIPPPERSVVITFDDGYRSVYEHAFPVLQRYGMTGTVFLATGNGKTRRLPSMEGRSMLSWHEIKDMHRNGITFGGHTLTHPDLTHLRSGLLENEVVGGKQIIEEALGTPVQTFAYPFGLYNDCCRALVSRHFVCACSDQLGLVHANTDIYAMERVDAYYLRTEKLLRLISSALLPLYVKARSVPRRIRRAVRLV
jgi:peptidoglycan/xylan/chitin deacetylase (PgdA/CDA1 family)